MILEDERSTQLSWTPDDNSRNNGFTGFMDLTYIFLVLLDPTMSSTF